MVLAIAVGVAAVAATMAAAFPPLSLAHDGLTDTGTTVLVTEDTAERTTLAFDVGAGDGRPQSVLVRIPDTGAIEAVIDPPNARGDVWVSEPAIMRDLRVVRVTYAPPPGSPMTRPVEVTLRATGNPGPNEKRRHHSSVSPAFHRLYKSTVVNYDREDAPGHIAAPQPGRDPLPYGARYLIITWSSFEELVEPLATWKHTKGMQTKVVTLAEVGSTPDDIRDYIQLAYDTWEVPPEYVLLVGDTEQVPVHNGLTHTDNYYATVDGADYLADVMVGRITADTPSQCSTQIAKILGYERTPLPDDPNWPASATLMIADDFDSGDWVYYMNTWFVYDLMDSAGFAPVDTLFRRNPIDMQDVYDSVNAGKGFLNFRGQALFNWMPPFDINPHLTANGWRLPVVVSATCGTGVYNVDGYICEDWVRAGTAGSPKGAVAFFGSNTIIMGSLELALRRGYVDEGFMANAFGPDGLTLGEACLAGKLNMHENDENWQEYEAWNLLGDPELNLWTGQPSDLTVLHDEAVQAAPSSFGVTVLREGELVQDALVACVKGSEVYAWGYTDGLGSAVIPISPSTPGTLAVTVTARNSFPYEGTVLVLPEGPFVAHAATAIDDAAGGNGDGLLSPGETVLIDVALSNDGSEAATALAATFRTGDAHATVIDSVSAYGEVAPDSTAWGREPFRISVAPDASGDGAVVFSLALTYSGTTGVAHPPPIAIATGRLAFAAHEALDDPPGGDGDGIAGAGETVALTLTLANDGECALETIEGTLSTSDEYLAVTTAHAAFTDAAASETCDNGDVPFILSVSPVAPDEHVASLSLSLTAAGHSYQYSEVIDLEIALSGQSTALPTGPDAYGYYAYDQGDSAYGPAPVYDWVDIAPPGPGVIVSEITNQDAATTTVGLWFDFPYYGTTYDQISICSNGFVAMGFSDYRFGDNSSIPNPHGPANMISPFWTDLDPSAGGDIYHWLDIANQRLIIQFDEVRHWNSQNAETFQVVLLNPTHHPTPTGDGMILFQYENVTSPGFCTVGIENADQTDGLEWLYDGAYGSNTVPLADGTAILFTTIAPADPSVPWLVVSDVEVDDAFGGNGDGLPQPGETVSLVLTLTNEGAVAATSLSLVLSSSESAITLNDSTAAFPDVPPGGSSQNAGDPLTITVAEAVTDSVATLWANVTANGGDYSGSGRIDLHINSTGTGVEETEMPLAFGLRPAYPNPFAGGTRMVLALPERERVTVRIYSAAGRLVRTLVNAPMDAGRHALSWNGTDRAGGRVASGVYFVKCQAGAMSATRKVMFLK